METEHSSKKHMYTNAHPLEKFSINDDFLPRLTPELHQALSKALRSKLVLNSFFWSLSMSYDKLGWCLLSIWENNFYAWKWVSKLLCHPKSCSKVTISGDSQTISDSDTTWYAQEMILERIYSLGNRARASMSTHQAHYCCSRHYRE